MDIIYFFQARTDLFLVFVAFIALFVGSFLNVVIFRLPRMMQNAWLEECRLYLGLKAPLQEPEQLSLAFPASHCTQCKKKLKPWHNIPLLSYLFLRGRCSYCKASISLRYPVVELLSAVASVYLAWQFGVTWFTLGALVFTWILISLTFIDLDFHLLPDQLTLGLLWIGLFCSLFNLFCSSHDAILGALAGYLIFALVELTFKLFTGKTGMGQGDFKLLAALGAFLGWQRLPIVILLASFIGIIFGVTHMFIRREFKSVPLPFGPYLAVAGWVSFIWGTEILSAYWQFVGPHCS